MKKSQEHDSETLDLTKSADVTEKFRSKQMLPWEVAIAVLYAATVIGFLIAVDVDSYRRIEFWIACGLFLIFGVALVVANLNIINVKDDNDKRRALLVSVLNGGRGCRFITDTKDRVIYSNRIFHDWALEIFKDKLDDLRKVLKQDDKTLARFDEFVDMAKKGRRAEVLLPFTISDERKGWMNLVAQPILDWTGFIHWRIDDVTVSHLHEETLKSERKRLSDLMDNAPIGLFSVDNRGCFNFVNKTFCNWLAADEEDLLSGDYQMWHFLVDKPQSGKPYDILDEADDEGVQRGEVKLVGLDGRVFVASVLHTVVNDGEAGKNGFYTRSVIRDLTPEREWKRALKQSEDRFQRFFEEAPLGIALVDGEGRLTECNDAFSDMVKLPFQHMLGQNLVSLLTQGCRKKVEEAFENIKNGEKESVSLEVEFINPDKESIDNIMAQLFAGRFMGDTGIVLHFIDITAQKNLEKQFTQSQKMQAVGQLAGGVAHDFNNLLTAMIGFCDLLLMRHKAGDSSFGDIMQIKQNANRAANLVRQLLAFSRQQQLQPKVMDVTDVITEVSHLIRRLIGANIELKINHERDLGLVKIDVGQMEQVLINLAVNARDAMAKDGGGQLTIKTYNQETKRLKRVGTEELPAGKWVVIEVSDTGCGIPLEIIERIFDPFFSTKEVGAGTGLGLSTVYGIIKQTEGHIFVDSKVGKGTSFTMYLPRMSEELVKVAAKKEVEETRQDLTGSSRVFLVEDEDAVRAFSARALANKGYTVFEAASGELAVERLEKEKLQFDILVTDVIMPNMDGIQLSKIVKEKYPDVPVIFMSGYTEDRFRDEFDSEFYFLSKPFTLKQLAEKVKEVLEDN